MSTYCAIKSKLNGNVIDIQGASSKSGALLDAYPEKTGATNQMWEIVADPAGSGYSFVKSQLDGNVITALSTESGMLLATQPQKPNGADDQLWTFVPQSSSAGQYFVRNKLSGNVIDIARASKASGALLDAFPQKTAGVDNQLWSPVGAVFPPPIKLPSSLSWTNVGSGSNTTSSGATKCSWAANLTIQQDGSCRFWGSYTNRGDIPIFTAPNQTFGVVMVALDMNGKGYSFGKAGDVPSAPQSGCTSTWDLNQKSNAVGDNWGSIATRHQAIGRYNNYVGFWDLAAVLIGGVESAVAEVGTVVADVAPIIAAV